MGGSVLQNGDIELMIQRRTFLDDGRGVEEPLNETDSSGKGQSVYLYMKYILEGSYTRYDNSLEWAKRAQNLLERIPIIGFNNQDFNVPTSNNLKQEFPEEYIKIYFYPESASSVIV